MHLKKVRLVSYYDPDPDPDSFKGESPDFNKTEIQEIDIQETTMAFDKLNFFENIKSEAAGASIYELNIIIYF